jgi:hypothetical protein
MNKRKANRVTLFLSSAVAALICTGCISVVHDHAEVPGTNKTLMVGMQQGFLTWSYRIWVEENGQITRVKIVEEK